MKRQPLDRRVLTLLVAALMLLLFAACGGQSSDTAATGGANYEMGTASSTAAVAMDTERFGAEAALTEESGGGSLLPDTLENRKLIRTVDLTMETLEFDETLAALQQKLTELGGYIQNSSVSGNSYHDEVYNRQSDRSAYLTLRVPADQADSFLQSAASYGNILSQSEDLEDVTLSYTDLETRRESLETERDRLLELLEDAEDLEGIIQLEARLSEVQYEIESIVSSLRGYDNQIDYATIHLSLYEVQRITPVAAETLGDRIQTGFGETLQDIAEGAEDLFVWIVVNSPYLLIFALLVALLIVLLCLLRRRRAKRVQKLFAPPASAPSASDAAPSPDSDRTDDPPAGPKA